MATKQLDFKILEDEIRISFEGTTVAVIRYCLKKIYQVELLQNISRGLEHQLLSLVYLLSNLDMGNKDMTISDVLTLPQHELRNELRRRDITMARVAYEDITEALAAVLKRVAVKYLSVEVVPHEVGYRDQVYLVFELHSKHEFTFWKSEWAPDPETENLYIVPDYHPCMLGKKPIHMINGDTNYRTHGYSVVSVESPVESRAEMEKPRGCSWTHMKHPFHAKGTAIAVMVHSGLLRTKDGVRELSRFLLAALGKTDEFVEVCGGFQAPLYHAHNLLIEMGIPSPSKEKHYGQWTRGCEEFNVWAYRTLLAEGKLEGAYVPEWFLEEGWLATYEGTEEKPGLF